MPSLSTPHLSIAYTDTGPRGAPVVLLIHGWPDDASAWDQVARRLNAAGLRTVVPTLRGFGDTRLDEAAPRTGNSGVHALDTMALMDGLGVDRFFVAGHDWGANIAEALAVGWPERVAALAMLASPPRLGGAPVPAFWEAQRQWYHWFMATKVGEAAVRADRRGFAHRHWVNWGPPGWFAESTFQKVAKSWDNPDWVDVTLHSYRSRWGEAEPDPASAALEDKVRATETLSLPALFVRGEADGVSPPAASAQVRRKFTGPFKLLSLPDVGHFPHREAPVEVARELARLFGGNVRRAVGAPRVSKSGLVAGIALASAAAVAALAVSDVGGRSKPTRF